MRVIHGVIVLGVLGVACGSEGNPPPSPPATSGSAEPSPPMGGTTTSTLTTPCTDAAKPPDAPVTRKFAPDGSGNCVASSPDPDRVYICDYTKTVTWSFFNTCAAPVDATIGPRKADTAGNNDDPLDEGDTLYSDPSPVPKPPSAGAAGKAAIVAKVDLHAQNDCYKYSFGGTFPLDPEIEVRRAGLRKACTGAEPAISGMPNPPGKK